MRMKAGLSPRAVLLPCLLLALAPGASDGVEAPRNQAASPPPGRAVAGVAIDYPEEGSIFPPEITPPTFLWRDAAKGVASWQIEVSFGDGAAAGWRGSPPEPGCKPTARARGSGDRDRLSGRRIDFPARNHPADVPLAG